MNGEFGLNDVYYGTNITRCIMNTSHQGDANWNMLPPKLPSLTTISWNGLSNLYSSYQFTSYVWLANFDVNDVAAPYSSVVQYIMFGTNLNLVSTTIFIERDNLYSYGIQSGHNTVVNTNDQPMYTNGTSVYTLSNV